MKVLIVSKYFYPAKRASGVADLAYNISKWLSKKMKIVVASTFTSSDEKTRLSHEGFEIIKVKGSFPLGVSKVVREEKPDLIWIFSGVHNPNIAPLYFYPIKLMTKIPIILHQCTHFSSDLNPFFNRFWKKYDQVSATHPKIQKMLENNLKTKVLYLPPVLNIKDYPKLKKIEKNDKIKIGFFGYLDNIKGVDLVINTLKKINSKKVDLIISGLGPWENKIKEIAHKNKNMIFKGYLPKQKLISEMQKCDLIMLPYRASKTVLGYSYLAQEAMAMGIPVAASNQDIFIPLIEDSKNGIIFKNKKEMIEKVSNLILKNDKIKKLGENAYETIKNKYDVKIWEGEYLKLIKTNVNQKKKIQGYYDDYSSWYDKERLGKYYSVINELEFEAIRPYIKNKKSLELGCGTGIILNMADKVARDAKGIDLSPGMISVSKKKGLSAQVASATDLPFSDREFDVVYSFKVLAHIPDIKKAILEATRVTKPKGKLVLEFYNPYSIKFLTNKIQKFFVRKKVYIRYDSLKNIKSYLPKDLKVTEIKGVRIITPFNFLFKIPIISPFFKFLEDKLALSPLKYLGSYFVVTMEKR